MRTATITRKTKETQIDIVLTLEGRGISSIKTPVGFFNHMLTAFAKHGLFNLELAAKGDMEIDQHHTIEDCGIVLGDAFRKALGDKKGVNRTGFFAFPMDEVLAIVAIDLGGRPYLQYKLPLKRRMCGELDCDVLEDFFQGFVNGLQCNVAIRVPSGRSDHHKIEAVFKAFGKAMKMACSKDARMLDDIPSTKGVL